MKKHIPNIITCSRLFFIPIFIFFMIKNNYTIAATIFCIAGLSDLLDGFLARKWKVVSNFGKLADPLADKAIQISAVLLMVIYNFLNPAFLIVLGIKESLMIYGSYLLYKKKVIVYADWYGKLAALLLNAAIFWILILKLNSIWANSFMAIAYAAEILALILYTVRYFRLKREAEEKSAIKE